MYRAKRIIILSISVLFLILIDQLTKAFIIDYLQLHSYESVYILPILNIVYSWNYGISFGLFSEYTQYSNIIFCIINSIIVLYILYLLLEAKNYISTTGLVLIVSGAIGNIIDRILRGAVFDFLDFHYSVFTFPAFNFADSFITIGACCIIYNELRAYLIKKGS